MRVRGLGCRLLVLGLCCAFLVDGVYSEGSAGRSSSVDFYLSIHHSITVQKGHVGLLTRGTFFGGPRCKDHKK